MAVRSIEPSIRSSKESGPKGTNNSEPGRTPQEGPMSVSTRTVQQPLGTRQMGAVLVAIALALVLAAAVAIGQLATTKVQTAPAPGAAPAFIDHGSRGEMAAPAAASHGYMSAAAAAAAPVITKNDEMRTDRVGSSGSNSGGPRLRPR
jgi:hypothetical protein